MKSGIFTLFLVFLWGNCYGISDFVQLKEENCFPLQREEMLKLPQGYHRYLGFTKMCTLTRNESDKKWKVSLISIWAHDYLDAKGDSSEWEDFPAPILIDNRFKNIGSLPEHYPMDWATHLIISYGRWHSGKPEEIWIDVSNPAVSGDYYYRPLRWNSTKGRYEMKTQEPITGRRP